MQSVFGVGPPDSRIACIGLLARALGSARRPGGGTTGDFSGVDTVSFSGHTVM